MVDQSNFSVYRKWLKAANWLEMPVLWLGQLSAWLMLPLVGIIMFDAVCRKFLRKTTFAIETGLYHLMNSPVLQDSEWHLHTIMFLVSIGYAYAYNVHVRLDIFRPRLGIKRALVGGSLRRCFSARSIFECSDLLRVGLLSSRLGDRRRDVGADRVRQSLVYQVVCTDRIFPVSAVRDFTDHSSCYTVVGPGGSNR